MSGGCMKTDAHTVTVSWEHRISQSCWTGENEGTDEPDADLSNHCGACQVLSATTDGNAMLKWHCGVTDQEVELQPLIFLLARIACSAKQGFVLASSAVGSP